MCVGGKERGLVVAHGGGGRPGSPRAAFAPCSRGLSWAGSRGEAPYKARIRPRLGLLIWRPVPAPGWHLPPPLPPPPRSATSGKEKERRSGTGGLSRRRLLRGGEEQPARRQPGPGSAEAWATPPAWKCSPVPPAASFGCKRRIGPRPPSPPHPSSRESCAPPSPSSRGPRLSLRGAHGLVVRAKLKRLGSQPANPPLSPLG